MSEILFNVGAAVLVAAVFGLIVYRAGQASGRRLHRAEARAVWEARMKGDPRPAREILGHESQHELAEREATIERRDREDRALVDRLMETPVIDPSTFPAYSRTPEGRAAARRTELVRRAWGDRRGQREARRDE